ANNPPGRPCPEDRARCRLPPPGPVPGHVHPRPVRPYGAGESGAGVPAVAADHLLHPGSGVRPGGDRGHLETADPGQAGQDLQPRCPGVGGCDCVGHCKRLDDARCPRGRRGPQRRRSRTAAPAAPGPGGRRRPGPGGGSAARPAAAGRGPPRGHGSGDL
ncbi:transmembrane transport protein, partial [Arthrobacter sp. DR-2P]